MDYPFKFPQSDFDQPRFYGSKSTNTGSIYFTRPVLRGCAYLPFQPTIMLNVSPTLATIDFKDEMRSPETPFASHGVAEG